MVLLDPALDGPTNMRRDTALLNRGEFGCRVYSWDGPWVTLGRFQNPERDLVKGNWVPWVMRPTGGKAVLHGHDTTVGLTVPLRLIDCSSRDVKKAYRRLITPIVEALNACGMNVALAEGTTHESRGMRTSDCFAFNSANDVVDVASGLKVCGCALQLTEEAVLLQASIPYRSALVDPREVIKEATEAEVIPWDPTQFAPKLEEALRYNFSHVSA